MPEAARQRRSALKVVNVRLVKEPSLYSTERIQTPDDAIRVIADELKAYDRECFCILNLKTDGKPINLNVVSIGTLNSAMVDPSEVFKSAILANSAAVICVHNHPSGNPQASQEDIVTTKRLIRAGQLLNIPVQDHIIVSGESGETHSMRREGLMEDRNRSWDEWER